MEKATFWSMFVSINLLFVFIKIYQHNIYAKEVFTKQKLLAQTSNLNLEIDKLGKELLSIKNNNQILTQAQNLGMQPLQISQVDTFEKGTSCHQI